MWTILTEEGQAVQHTEDKPNSGSYVQGKKTLGMFWDGGKMVPSLPKKPKPKDVKKERDRRLHSDFEFNGKMFQRDQESLARITGAATLAGFAIAGGAQPGNLRWANSNVDFGWIASDDTVVPMDAQTAFAFGQVAAGVETAIIFAAKSLREMNPIPEDYTDDKWW